MSIVSCGIVGLPNVGKSTLFNALTEGSALVANYPFATIDPNIGIVAVPDERLKVLADIYKTDKIVPATVTFTDIAGLVAGASQGEGLGNRFLSHIRNCQAIVQVVRAFDDSTVQHVDNEPNPKRDIDTVNTELVLADLATIERHLLKIEKEARANPKLIPIVNLAKKAHELLDSDTPLWSSAEDWEDLADLQLITTKPVQYVFNVSEEQLTDAVLTGDLAKLVQPAPSLNICAKLEAELNELDQSDRQELLSSYSLNESGLQRLVKQVYDLLSLQSFLTAGAKEVRAWTVEQGSTAPKAAGVIHSDFERGFIAAEVVSYAELVNAGSLTKARSNGQARTEGRDYVVKPDDIIEFKFNVSK